MLHLRNPRVRRSARALIRVTGTRSLLVAWRHRGLVDRDVFIASYPRPGSTWLRFLLFDAIDGEEAGFESVPQSIPYIGRHSGAPALLADGGRIVKTHEPYSDRYARAIYLVRDPRDVVLSEHAYQGMRGLHNGDLDRFVADFAAGEIHAFGSWTAHVGSWLDGPMAGTDRLLVLRFEELLGNPIDTLHRAIRFLGFDLDDKTVKRAIANNTVERMKAKENRVRAHLFPEFKKGMRFVNSGESEGWRHRLSADQQRIVEVHGAAVMERFGYSVD